MVRSVGHGLAAALATVGVVQNLGKNECLARLYGGGARTVEMAVAMSPEMLGGRLMRELVYLGGLSIREGRTFPR